MNNLRLLAARVINKVTDGASLTDTLESTLSQLTDVRDRAFIQAICYGVCRFYTRLDIILSLLLKKPMKAKDSDLHALLLVGLYQLGYMRVADYAVVAETVNAVEKLKKPWGRGLVNAVLREYLRRKEAIDAEVEDDEEAHYAHPQWWIDAVKTDWPQQWQAILMANNQHPPFSLRVNQRIQSREAYLAMLNDQAIVAKAIPQTQSGLIVETPTHVESLPGFARGEISVQDGAAQLAGELFSLAPSMRVLDACAAPGGKLIHLLEREPQLTMIAVEKDPARMISIKENLARSHVSATCLCHDVGEVSTWWDGKPFDRILLDAPCSASGVIRRHPDIKLLRDAADIKALAKEQRRLLAALWPLLAPQGYLLYCTCSIFHAENEVIVKEFLAATPDAREEKLTVTWGESREVGRQILPGMHEMDGFYYALIKKM